MDEEGCEVTLANWAQLVLFGQWKAPGVGEARMLDVREALAQVLRF